MAATLTSTFNLSLTAILQNSVGLANVQAPVIKSLIATWASGTGVSQADKIFSESAKSLNTNYDVDLAGVLTDVFGATITFARIKALLVFADPNNGAAINVGGAAANQFFGFFGAATHTVNVRQGGALVMYAPDSTGWVVTASTADILRFAPASGTQLMDWAIIGASV